jgi:hypothetical protein
MHNGATKSAPLGIGIVDRLWQIDVAKLFLFDIAASEELT